MTKDTEPHEQIFELLSDGKHILKPDALILYSDNGDSILVREIPLLRQRIAELEKEVEQAELRGERRGFYAARERVVDPKHYGAMTVGGPVTKLRYENFDDYKRQKG